MKRSEDGAGVVLALGMIALLMFVALLAAGSVAVVAHHRQAQAAADLAALAAAANPSEGCATAARISLRNGARLTSCSFEGGDVTVVVQRQMPALLGLREVTARARAGPG